MLLNEMNNKVFLDHIVGREKWSASFNLGQKGVGETQLSLRKKYIKDAQIENRNLSGSELIECLFEEVSFEKCNFHSANLLATGFIKCAFHDCEFWKTDMNHGNYTKSKFLQSRFVKTDLTRSILMYTELSNVSMGGVKLVDADLRFANLEGIELYSSALIRTKFYTSEKFKPKSLRDLFIEDIHVDMMGIGETYSDFQSLSHVFLLPS
jgi:uncharacterized protein YjbI with pentapeptide repeats